MWKKVLGVGAVLIAGIGLAVWGAGPKSVATSDDGNVTQSKYYKELKQTPTGQQTLANMIVNQVLDKKYGKEVANKDVTKKYNETHDQMGSQFEQQLTASGMTPQTYRDSVKLELLERQAVKAHTNFSNAGLKKIYKEYQPKTSASVILMGSKSDAEKIVKELNDGQDFTELAKKYSGDSASKKNGGKLDDFDPTSTKVDPNVKKAAFKLKDGEYTKTPVQASTNSVSLHLLSAIRKKRSLHIDKMKGDQKNIKVNEVMSDQDEVNAIVGKELGKANVDIKDPDMKNVLSKYTEAAAAQAAKENKK